MTDNVWMTYDEAAKAMGIKKESVQRRAALRKWPKRKGNGRKVQVGIPADAIPELHPENHGEIHPDINHDKMTEITAENAGLKAEVKQLNMRLDDAKADNAKLIDMMTEMTRPAPSLWARIWGSRS